jgi:hypothetical protein
MFTLTPSDFLLMMEQQLRPTGTPFARVALIAFVDACWPWMSEDPDVELWAAKFLATGDVMAPA